MSATAKSQIFTIPTFDAAFKWILSLDSIRLDDHMNPIQALQLARYFVHDDKTQKTVDLLKKAGALEVYVGEEHERLKNNKQAT